MLKRLKRRVSGLPPAEISQYVVPIVSRMGAHSGEPAWVGAEGVRTMAAKKPTKMPVKKPKPVKKHVEALEIIPKGMTLADWVKQQEASRDTATVSMFSDLGRMANIKMTPHLKAAYCEALARTGRQIHAAQACGVVPETIQRHRKLDPEFDHACELARRAYADWVISKVQDMAFNGVVTERKLAYDEQGEEDGVIVKRAFLPALVQMEARRVEPEYRDKQELKVDVTQSHVLMVPEQKSATEDWEQFAIAQQIDKPTENE